MMKQESFLKKLQDGIGKALAIVPLSPNAWTFLSVIAALAAGFSIAFLGDLRSGILLFALAGFIDLIDGAIARAKNKVTRLGAFLDGVSDRFVEAIFLFSFLFYPLPEIFFDAKIWVISTVFLGTCMPSFIRAYADHKEVITKRDANQLGGLCERSERITLLVLGLAGGVLFSMHYFVLALITITGLSVLTILQRLYHIARMHSRI